MYIVFRQTRIFEFCDDLHAVGTRAIYQGA